MSERNLLHQIEHDRRLVDQLPRAEQDALRYEVSWSLRNSGNYSFERSKDSKKA